MRKHILLTVVLLGGMTPLGMAQSQVNAMTQLIEAGEKATGEIIQKGQEISAGIKGAIEATIIEQERAAYEAVRQVTGEKTTPRIQAEQISVTEVPGVGTVRSFQLTPNASIDYGLEVPTRRGHTDHFVPMDLERIIQRWDINYKNTDMRAKWQEIGGKTEYTDPIALSQDIHRLYEGKGIPAQEVFSKKDVLIYTLPFDGISYIQSGVSNSLQKADYLIVFYPSQNRGQLLQFNKDGLRFYRLKPDAAVAP